MANTTTGFMSKPQPYVGKDRLAALAEDDPNEVQDQTAVPGDTVTPDPSAEAVLFKKRYGDSVRHIGQINEEKNSLAADNEKLTQELSRLRAGNISYVPKTPEEIQDWREEFPEAADVIHSLIKNENDAATEEIRAKQSDIDERLAVVARKEAAQQLKQLHPDADDIRAKAEFHAWVAEQSPQVQALLYENETDAEAAAAVIDMYKARPATADAVLEPVNQQRQNQVNASLDVGANQMAPNLADDELGGRRMWRESEIGVMKPHEYEANEAEIDKAMAEGRIIFDVKDPNPRVLPGT